MKPLIRRFLPMDYRRKSPSLIALLGAVAAFAPECAAEIHWHDDFEQADFGRWSYILNPQGVERVTDPADKDNHAARLVVRGEPEYLWNGDPNLNRVELQYRPERKRTRQGADLYFGWRFMLPRPLSEAGHEFGYWESDGSYRQSMRFNLHGESISFQFSNAESTLWRAAGAVTPGQWHDIAMHIHWSTRADEGRVSVWFNGERVVHERRGRTLIAGDEAMFVQIGLLRARHPLAETVYIDDAREGSDIESVLTAAEPAARE